MPNHRCVPIRRTFTGAVAAAPGLGVTLPAANPSAANQSATDGPGGRVRGGAISRHADATSVG